MRHGFCSDIACGSEPILDDELLAKSLRESLSNQAARDVLRPAGSDADDKPHRLHGIIERRCRS